MMKKTAIITVSIFLSIGGVNFYTAVYAEPNQIKAIKAVEEAQAREQNLITRPKVEYKAGFLRDPFTGVVAHESVSPGITAAQEAPPDLIVQGIIWGGRFPQAIINNKVLGVGDSIQGARIISIGKGGVTVLFGGNNFTLGSPTNAGSGDSY